MYTYSRGHSYTLIEDERQWKDITVGGYFVVLYYIFEQRRNIIDKMTQGGVSTFPHLLFGKLERVSSSHKKGVTLFLDNFVVCVFSVQVYSLVRSFQQIRLSCDTVLTLTIKTYMLK